MLNKKSKKIITDAIIIVLALSCVVMLAIDKNLEHSRLKNVEAMAAENEQKVTVTPTKAPEKLPTATPTQKPAVKVTGIVCWGDGLTAGETGKPSFPELLGEKVSVPVVNMGIKTESSLTVAARAGAIPMVASAFTIPGDKTKVRVELKSLNGQTVGPLLGGDHGINPVDIGGVSGRLSIKDSKYYFSRQESGKSVQVKDKTPVMTASSSAYKEYMPIIFVGQNGRYESEEELKSQIDEFIKLNSDSYIVLGLTTGDAASRAKLEEIMQKSYGDNYINLREIMSKNGVSIAGVTETQEDKDASVKGMVPPSLLNGRVEFNQYGYKAIASIINERIKQLGYIK